MRARVDPFDVVGRAVAFDRLGACAALLDGDGVIVDTNESWRLYTRLNDGDVATTGPGANYLRVCEVAALAGVAGAGDVAIALREVLNGERQRMDFEYPCPTATEDRWYLLRASAAPIANGMGAVLFHVDITDRKLVSDRLAALAGDDALTGLPNRRSGVKYLEEQLAASHDSGRPVWVFFIDVNDFKAVNDQYGHHTGDELLCNIAVRARHRLRPNHCLARLGGDEFVLICPGLDRGGAVAMAERLRSVMADPFQIGDIELRVGISVGFVSSDTDSSVRSLLAAADREMYLDKRKPGRTPLRVAASIPAAHLAVRDERQPFVASVTGERPDAHVRRLAVLAAAQRTIASAKFDAAQIGHWSCEWALTLAAAEGVTVEMRDGPELVCAAVSGRPSIDVGSRRSLAGSAAEAAMETGRPIVLARGDRAEPDLAPRATVVVPLVATEGVPAEGVLTVTGRESARFDDQDVLGLEVIAGIAGGIMAKTALLVVLRRTGAQYQTLIDHLPGTAALVFDQHLCLLVVAGPGARLWRYAERNVAPGRFLWETVSPAELAILEPFYRSALVAPGTLDYHSADTGLDFHFAAVPIPNPDGDVDQLLVTVTDVTQRKADEETLREAERSYRSAFVEAPVGMARTSLAGRFEAVNIALCELTGYSSDELGATTLMAITHPDDLESDARARVSMVEGRSSVNRTEKRLVRADGQHIWVAYTATVVHDASDRPLYMLSHFLDIAERKRFESELQHLADHDSLTGLANRRSFEAALSRQVASIARHGHAGALLVLDLDHFKQINDTLGHRAGDELIVSLAGMLRQHLQATDVVGRLGGDEFAVMLPYATAARAERIAANLLDAVRTDETLLGGIHRRKVTTSIGIAYFDDPDVTGAEMLINADLAMYDAKEAGRDRYAVHQTSNTQPTTRARLEWVDRITHALDHDRFTLYAQPIMHLATRQITRHELLLRMIDDDGEIISPATFLHVAEKFGLISRIDRWVVDHAVGALASYADRRLSFEMNLSGVSMGDASLLAFIEQRLKESPGVDPSQLTFEVTETAAVANLGAAREFADRLTALGCSFSLDDFGAGFGSFYYLKYLPFTDLKIDGEFITHCLSNPTDQLVVQAVVTLAQGLEKHTIAEYVGDQDTLEFLAAIGVDYAQGFHVGRPVPLERAMLERSADPGTAG